MRKIFTLIAVTTLACATWAQESVKVIAEGRGATQEEAVKQAKAAAVEAACGSIIKSHTEIKGDEIKSELLSLSNGFISTYRVVAPYRNQTVRIEATVELQKAKDWVARRTMLIKAGNISADSQSQAGDFEKRRQAFTTMLISLLKDYALIHQFTISGDQKLVQHQNKPALQLNFEFFIQTKDYRDYLRLLERNLKSMGMHEAKQPAGNSNFSVIFNPTLAKGAQKVRYVNSMWVDQNRMNKELHPWRLKVKIEALDEEGEPLTETEFYLDNKQIDLMGNSVEFRLPGTKENPFWNRGTVILPLLSPGDAANIKMYRISVGDHWIRFGGGPIPGVRLLNVNQNTGRF